MTPKLGADDAARVLEASRDLWPPGPDFRVRAGEAVRRLIPCQQVMFNRTDLDAGLIDFVIVPREFHVLAEAAKDDMARALEHHPIVDYYLRTASSRPMRVSDSIPLAEWRSSLLYREFLEPMGLRWTMLKFIPTADRCINSISLFSEAEHDFTERDQAVLDVFTPMLALGCGGAPSSAEPSRLDGMAGWAMVSITDDGKLGAVSPPDALAGLAPGMTFPNAALRAVRDSGFGELVVVEVHGHTWQVQPLGRRGGSVVAFVRPADERDAVRRLSDRQLEVLEQVALGHTNGRIARELGIAEGTARKHVEQLLAQLGAGNRAEAVAIWHRSRSARR